MGKKRCYNIQRSKGGYDFMKNNGNNNSYEILRNAAFIGMQLPHP